MTPRRLPEPVIHFPNSNSIRPFYTLSQATVVHSFRLLDLAMESAFTACMRIAYIKGTGIAP
jgi:hypothetical protein